MAGEQLGGVVAQGDRLGGAQGERVAGVAGALVLVARDEAPPGNAAAWTSDGGDEVDRGAVGRSGPAARRGPSASSSSRRR